MDCEASVGAAEAGGRWLGLDRRWWVLAVVGSGTFMSALDTSIVSVALPAIGHATGAILSTLEWVVLAYLLAVSSTLLVFGRLADLHGRRRIYLCGQVGFALGSLLCALARGVGPLVAARAFQGLGASMVFALSPAVLIGAFPAAERGRALGLQATMTYLGMSIGPGLGGWLTEHLGWPAVFLVNVPVGAVMIAVSLRALPRDPPRDRAAAPFDALGAGLLAAALAGLLLAASQGPARGWGDPWVVALAAGAALAGVAFVGVERRRLHPALDVSLFRSFAFSASTAAAFLCYACTAAVNLTAPFLLVRSYGLPESRAGLLLMVVPLGMLLLTAAAGHLSDRVGVRLPSTLGMVLLTGGALALSRASPAAGAAGFVPGALAIGLGNGLFTAPNNSAIMGAAPLPRRGVAGAVLAAARTAGFACGTALAAIVSGARLRALGTATPAVVAEGARACFQGIVVMGVAAAVLCALRRGAR
jgi:EmrB/QacA subfamily drug resistance transporter